MGHIPTITMSVFAAILSGLYFAVPEPMQFTMLAFIGAAWFIAVICWLSQKSADYAHKYAAPSHSSSSHTEQSTESRGHNPEGGSGQAQQQTMRNQEESSGSNEAASEQEIERMKTKLTNELDTLRSQLQNKDEQIERLQGEINNLRTQVQIESLKSELANLKALAAKEDKSG